MKKKNTKHCEQPSPSKNQGQQLKGTNKNNL
jgi:hypothetical protein